MGIEITPAWIDAILVGVAIEFGALAAWLTARSARRWITPLLLFLASGAALMIALRSALAGTGPGSVEAALGVSFFTHVGAIASVIRLSRRASP